MDRRLIVEPLPSEEDVLRWTTPSEQGEAARFSPLRKRGYLGWRAIVRRELGWVEIGYDAVGAPLVRDAVGVRIGVSHGAGRVAVAFSNRPCAVDIERRDRSFGQILERYLTSGERELCSEPWFAAVAWSAKETLYKLSGRQGLTLRTDLRLEALGADWIDGRIEGFPAVRLSFRIWEDAVMVWWL